MVAVSIVIAALIAAATAATVPDENTTTFCIPVSGVQMSIYNNNPSDTNAYQQLQGLVWQMTALYGKVLERLEADRPSTGYPQQMPENVNSTIEPELTRDLIMRLLSSQNIQQASHDSVTPSTTIPPRDCYELLLDGYDESDVYTIWPENYPEPFSVFCDMDTDGGGWTVFQKRVNGTIPFYRKWDHYVKGFGSVQHEFWLGLDKIYALTSQKLNVLRVDLRDFAKSRRFAEYDYFRLGEPETFYELIIGRYSGDAADSMAYSKYLPFSTYDADHDLNGGNCAKNMKGAWWYNSCHHANLNGPYFSGASAANVLIEWKGWKGTSYSLQRTEMKIRPVPLQD